MFRTALFSIVFSLAIGQNASLLCKVWCDPGAAAASGCHHARCPTDSPKLIGDDCDANTRGGDAFLKEEGRRSVSATDGGHAIAAPHYQFALGTAGARADRAPWRSPPLETRPLDIALRI